MRASDIVAAIKPYWFPRGHLNEDQRDFLISYLSRAKPQYCLETGFASGRSAITTLVAARPKKLVSIDINLDYIDGGRAHALEMMKEFPALTVIEGSSHSVMAPAFMAKTFPAGLDFAWIDGIHTYEGCRGDLERVAPYLSGSGAIMVDDYMSGPPKGVHAPTVTAAVNDFAAAHGFRLDRWSEKGKGIATLRPA